MPRSYNAPPTTPSTVGSQLVNEYYQKQALIEARKEQYFSQLADTISMPKNMGKKIKRYHYLPMLDDANLNDQGIDANGIVLSNLHYFATTPDFQQMYDTEALATTVVNAINAAVAGAATKTQLATGRWMVTANAVVTTNATKVARTASFNDNINSATGTAVTVAVAAADSSAPGATMAFIVFNTRTIKYATVAKANVVVAFNMGITTQQASGNLYGSSKDVGSISGKLPALSESGGRVNRVGFKRVELEGTLEKFGFFDEYTQESVDFDTDAELMQHINREMVNGANEITEDALQIDLLNSAGVVRFAGDALATIDMSGAGVVGAAGVDIVTYTDLMNLSIVLDNNRTPKHTKVITGTRMVDTKTLPAARVAYIGSELLPTFKGMKDLHGNPAFISIEKYAAGGTTLNGEVGAVDQFRLVVVPEMMKWAGAGADSSADATCYETNNRFDVFPILVIGDESFTTIGFQTDGKSVKFKIYHKAPGEATADRNDPYGETGFMSIKWYYGFMVLRSERIGLIKTCAKM